MKRIGIALMLLGTACAAATYRRPLERVASMDPIHASAVYDSRAVSLVYEPLLEIDYEARPYRLRGLLAEGLPEISEDGLEWTFRLRGGRAGCLPMCRRGICCFLAHCGTTC